MTRFPQCSFVVFRHFRITTPTTPVSVMPWPKAVNQVKTCKQINGTRADPGYLLAIKGSYE